MGTSTPLRFLDGWDKGSGDLGFGGGSGHGTMNIGTDSHLNAFGGAGTGVRGLGVRGKTEHWYRGDQEKHR